MSIVRTRTYARPDTTVPFHRDSGLTQITALQSGLQTLINAGTFSSTPVVSDDGLTLTHTQTLQDLAALGALDTVVGIALDAEYFTYITEHGHAMVGHPVITGIDSAFTVNTTYTFPTAGTASHDSLSALVSTYATLKSDYIVSNTVADTVITVVAKFNNGDDYVANRFNDFSIVTELNTDGATRAITYAAV